MIRRFSILLAALMLAGCGGGGSGSSASSGADATAPIVSAPVTPAATANVIPLTLDAGPAALQVGDDGYSAFNQPYVTITLCAPGSTSNCQVIDHVILDTGSVGLRMLKPVLNADLLAALPTETDGSANSYVFGSVRSADFTVAGETVAGMPFQVIADDGAFATVPAGCSAGGGTQVRTVQDFGANGILGVGTTTTDCGALCTVDGGSSAAIYYDCPSAGCGAVIGRAMNAAAPFQQLPNPVAAFATDNNGVILSLPAVPPAGVRSLTGTATFGIGTQADNALHAANVLPLTTSASRLGPGVLTATYNGKALTQSFIDSGSDTYFFIDGGLAPCTDKELLAFYCPSAPTSLSPTLTATNGVTASAAFTLYSPLTFASTSDVAPGVGVNPTLVTPPLPFANSFDFGIPFFFGRTVYTSIEGRPAGGLQGPYYAF